MSEGEKNYSDYVKHLSNLMSGMLFLAGFTFTVVTILLTRLPDSSSVQSQLILLFFTVFFYLLIFLASHFAIEVIYYCENIPQLSIKTRITNTLVVLVIQAYSNPASIGCLSSIIWCLTNKQLQKGVSKLPKRSKKLAKIWLILVPPTRFAGFKRQNDQLVSIINSQIF